MVATYQNASHTGFGGSASTSITVPKPTGTAADDILVLVLHLETASASVTTTGWTLGATASDSVGPLTGVLMWRRADATDVAGSSYTFTFASSFSTASIYRYSGAATSGDPFGGSLVALGSHATALPSMSYTATGTGLGGWWYQGFTDGATVTIPSGYTLDYSLPADAALTAAHRTDAAGSLSTGAATTSSTSGATCFAGDLLDAVTVNPDPGYGYYLLEDGSGDLQLEESTSRYLLDTAASLPGTFVGWGVPR